MSVIKLHKEKSLMCNSKRPVLVGTHLIIFSYNILENNDIEFFLQN